MVRHEAERVDFEFKFLGGMVEDVIEVKAVLIVSENITPVVSADDDVVKGAGDVDTLFSGHAIMIAEIGGDSNLQSLTPGDLKPSKPDPR
jgi:hypothetical protein